VVEGKVIVSAVVPVYAGAQHLRAVVVELERMRDKWLAQGAPMTLAEVILVNDGAIDESPEIIDQLVRERSWITGVHLSRNFGQHPATIAGILNSSGDWIVTLDEDLQHPPSRIEDLLREAARADQDVVYANPKHGAHRSFRDLASILFKWLIAKLSGNPAVRHFNSFRLIRGSIARAAASVCGHETYLDVALGWFTQRIGIVQMDLRDDRTLSGGKTGYPTSMLISHARRLLMSSQAGVFPFSGALGALVFAGSLSFAGALAIWALLYGESVSVVGWSLLIATTAAFGGLITFLLGLALEHLVSMSLSAHGKPTFFSVQRSDIAVLRAYFDRNAP
jgi:glycosyltransferase involved in cell wall biosynthesis